MGSCERLKSCREYMEALEEEKRKIQVFQRELPLCLHLVTQAINTCREQLELSNEEVPARSGYGETSGEDPPLEEFFPLKRSTSETTQAPAGEKKRKPEDQNDKPDWLRSVQLWNSDADPSRNEDAGLNPKLGTKKQRGAFQPFSREREGRAEAVSGSGNERVKVREKEREREKEGQPNRKSRRCWSPELHRRFLHALQQLGGSHTATPKQIRELMKVDGLTNDEVKSHLQKYRLHTRRPAAVPASQPINPQAPQFVVVGGIWGLPEYAVPTPSPVTCGAIYATPIRPLPPPCQEAHQEKCSPTGPLHSDAGQGVQREGGASFRDEHSASASSSSARAVSSEGNSAVL
ncbi:hypothetical protein AMTRI_Chr12g236410 [Amborella trichopoda]